MSRKDQAGPAIRTRLFVEHDLAEGLDLRLEAGPSHLLRNVLRLEVGQSVGVFNGRDGEWRADIFELPKSGARLRLVERRRAQSGAPDVWLCFAPLKKSAIDMVATKATELGVGRLRPVITAQTAVTRVNVTRLQANAIEAAEQCERLDVPEVDQPVELLKLLEEWPTDRPLLVCAEAGNAEPIEAEARKLAGQPYGILVGPEGGFTSRELD
ncbi:MAG: 16S rRNA (uracil(1498)-N(3))-methyltransferase, partial [Pseudomonadota bacterium]